MLCLELVVSRLGVLVVVVSLGAGGPSCRGGQGPKWQCVMFSMFFSGCLFVVVCVVVVFVLAAGAYP